MANRYIKIFKFTIYQRHTNQNYIEISSHPSQNSRQLKNIQPNQTKPNQTKPNQTNHPTNQLTKQTNKETNNQTGNHEQWRQKEMLINYWYYTSLDNSVRRFPLRLKIDIANDWAIRPLDVILYYWDIFTSLFIIAPFTIVKLWKQPSSPSRNLCILVTFCLCDETPGSKAT